MNKIKELLKLIIATAIFFLIHIPIKYVLVNTFNLTIDLDHLNNYILYDFINCLLTVLIMLIIYKDLIKKSIKQLKMKDELSKFSNKVIIAYFVTMILKIGLGILVAIIDAVFGIEVSSVENQKIIETMMSSANVMMIISTCLFAPIYEELIFRGGIKQVIKNKRVYIAVSGLIFGLMHVTSSLVFLFEILLIGLTIDFLLSTRFDKKIKTILLVMSVVLIITIFGGIFILHYGNLINLIKTIELNELTGSLIYIAIGCYFAYLYVKDDNICTSIVVHILNNTFSTIALLFF